MSDFFINTDLIGIEVSDGNYYGNLLQVRRGVMRMKQEMTDVDKKRLSTLLTSVITETSVTFKQMFAVFLMEMSMTIQPLFQGYLTRQLLLLSIVFGWPLLCHLRIITTS